MPKQTNWYILFGVFFYNPWLAAILSLSVILLRLFPFSTRSNIKFLLIYCLFRKLICDFAPLRVTVMVLPLKVLSLIVSVESG